MDEWVRPLFTEYGFLLRHPERSEGSRFLAFGSKSPDPSLGSE
jgi:hypothetical protein